ncbi:MAG: radical SAM protein [Firmicutes bacterium]|nr:radical SAM protein [Bacillota bacterium]
MHRASVRARLRICDPLSIPLRLPLVGTNVTTRCTLRCKDCANLIPLFPCPQHIPAEEIITDFEHLLAAVDFIKEVSLIGGEPMMHPDLCGILQYFFEQPKVGRVSIQTNGTILPSPKLLQLLRHTKAFVIVSGYGAAVSKNLERLVALLRKEGIAHFYLKDILWFDFGATAPHARTAAKNRALFRKCHNNRCRNLSFGEFHLCARAINAVQLGLTPRHEGAYVDIRRAPAKETRLALLRLLSKPDPYFCDTCEGRHIASPRVTAAIQISERK